MISAAVKRQLAALGVTAPALHHAYALDARVFKLRIAVSDWGLAGTVNAEISPPWEATVPDDSAIATVGCCSLQEPVDLQRVLPVESIVSGDRTLNVATRDGCRLAQFQDSRSIVVYEAASASGLILLATPDADSDSREVLHRQIIQRHLESVGYVLLHGAGLSFDGEAVLLSGDSGVGKTSWQLDIAAACHAGLVGGGRVYSTPTGDMLPYVGGYSVGTEFALTRQYLQGLIHGRPGTKSGKFGIPSKVLADAIGSRLERWAQLKLVVLVERGRDNHVELSAPMSRQGAVEVLKTACLTPRDPKWPNWLNAFPSISERAAADRISELAGHVPVIRAVLPMGPSESAILTALRAFRRFLRANQ